MGLPDLYPAQVGSPYTTLAAPYTTGGDTMTVVDATKLPDAPNIVCLTGDVAGEFKYTGKDGNTLTGVTKLSGTPNATWPAGTYAFRGIAAYDHASIVEHLTYQRSHIVEATLDLTTNHSYSGRVLEGAEAGENLAFGDLVVLAESGKFVKANPTTLATLDGTIALVISDTIAAGSQGMFLLRGLIRNDSWTFSPGKELYASNGTLTHEPPATGTQIIRKVGTALTATIIEFNPSSTLHAEYLVSVLPVNTVTKDNGDVERKFWKDDFSVDSSDQYTVTGSITGWGSGEIALPTSGCSVYRSFDTPVSEFYLKAVLRFDERLTDEVRYLQLSAINPSTGQRVYSSRYQSGSVENGVRQFNGVSHGRYHAGISGLITDYATLEFWKVGSTLYTRINGGVIWSDPCEIDTTFSRFGVYAPAAAHVSELVILIGNPVSYADNFTTDTVSGANGRYQAVTGTVAYDDVNKRMTITAGAGVTAKTRLKSYTQLEGAYKRKLHLPATGTDGDVVAAYFGTDPTLASGFGIGAIRTAGAWNIATIDGATVTDTGTVIADLVDGDSFYVEVERDTTHGVVWYYVYKSGKPTTASGKLFNTYQEIYDGFWFKNNGAAENSIAVSEIEDRAESIVGRTNVQVEEPFWFRDEFGENSLGRYPKTQVSTLTSTISDGEWHVSDCFDTTWTLVPTTLKRGAFNFKTNLKYIATTGDTNANYLIVNIFGVQFRLHNYYGADLIYIGKTNAPYPVAFGNYDEIEFDISSAGIAKAYVNDVEILSVDISSSWIDAPVTMWVARAAGVNPSFDMKYLQISGTRVYNKPIHRGAMLETYHDGTQEVVGTTFIDDCQWDRSAEYTRLRGTWTHDTTNGYTQVANASDFGNGYLLNSLQFDEGVIEFDVCRNSVEGSNPGDYGVVLLSDGELNSSNYYFPKNGILVSTHSLSSGEYVNGAHVGSAYTRVTKAGNLVWQNWRIELKKSQGQILLYLDGVLANTYTIAQNHANKGIVFFAYNIATASNVRFKNIQIIAASPDATNGIAACIPPIGGGARYGVEESVYIPITPGTEIPVGSAVISPNAKSTVVGTALTTFAQTPAGVSASLEYATGTKTCPDLSTAFAPTGRHRVKADRNTLTNIGVKGSVAGTSPTVYIDSLHVRRQEVA